MPACGIAFQRFYPVFFDTLTLLQKQEFVTEAAVDVYFEGLSTLSSSIIVLVDIGLRRCKDSSLLRTAVVL